MGEQQVAYRFGRDAPSRIAGTAQMMTLAEAVLPGEPMYSPIPFFPPSIIDGASGSPLISSGHERPVWVQFPDPLDIYVYQGDDVQVPLYFQDPSDPDLDMSSWKWRSQIRLVHSYRSMLVAEFSIDAEFIPADVETGTTSATLVTLYLPRMHTRYIGSYHWDLASTAPFVGPDFPQPDDVEDWPMEDQVKTWLFGRVNVVPRVTETDWLPVPDGAAGNGDNVVVQTDQGFFFVGPNGRVP